MVVPKFFSRKSEKTFEEWLKVEVIKTNISGSVLIGSLLCANSNGLILPHFADEGDVERLRRISLDVNITIMDTKKTAYGNMILANNYGAIADPRISRRDLHKISNTLGVEVVPGQIAGMPFVGSLATVNNKGIYVHPLVREEEEEVLREVLKVDVGVGTVNCGIPYIATGMISNSYAAVAGGSTTGPEIFMIGQTLKVTD